MNEQPNPWKALENAKTISEQRIAVRAIRAAYPEARFSSDFESFFSSLGDHLADNVPWYLRELEVIKPHTCDCKQFIRYFETPEKAQKGVFTAIKPAKFIRKLNPLISNQNAESFANAFKTAYKEKIYTIVDSFEESQFVKAYVGEIVKGVYTSHYGVKSLSASCMRSNFGLPEGMHPAQAYASGDFRIVYAESEGLIGARCVVSKKGSAGPIYSNCNQATKAIKEYFEANAIDERQKWNGLKLKWIPHPERRDALLMPYVDCYNIGIYSNEESVYIGGDTSTSLSGYVETTPKAWCNCCEEGFDEDYAETTINGDTICRCCAENYYCYSGIEEVWIPQDEAYFCDALETYVTIDWIDSNGYVFTHDEELHDSKDCVLYDGDYYHNSDSCVVEFEGGYYHEDSDELKEAKERQKLIELSYEVKESWAWGWGIKNFASRYDPPDLQHYLTYTATSERTLRQNYQINQNGIPERIPELPLNLIGIEVEALESIE